MKAELINDGKTSKLVITFDCFTYTDGHGPYYVGGTFNGWDIAGKQFKIPQPPQRGANTLNDFVVDLGQYFDTCEFKIWDSGYNTWVEPSFDADVTSIYFGLPPSRLVRNIYGSLNVRAQVP